MAREFGRPSSFKRGRTRSGEQEPNSASPLQPVPPTMTLGYPRAKRGSDILRIFPVLFVVLIVLTLYTIFVAFHCLPLLQLDLDPDKRDAAMFTRGLVELVVFHVIFLLFCACYILVVVTPAGTIPNTPEWTETSNKAFHPVERKREGARRFCKWCDKYKPDRAHHCRQCRQCILKMDHHCPWIYNCVGWGNHKYFILTLLYATLLTFFVAGFQFESVKAAIDEPQIRFGVLLLLLFGESVSCFLGLLCLGFFGLHSYLIWNNMSTIEFCEKRYRTPLTRNVYDRGPKRNLTDVFGHNMFLYLLPIDDRPGDGVHFPVTPEMERLLREEEDDENVDTTEASGMPVAYESSSEAPAEPSVGFSKRTSPGRT